MTSEPVKQDKQSDAAGGQAVDRPSLTERDHEIPSLSATSFDFHHSPTQGTPGLYIAPCDDRGPLTEFRQWLRDQGSST